MDRPQGRWSLRPRAGWLAGWQSVYEQLSGWMMCTPDTTDKSSHLQVVGSGNNSSNSRAIRLDRSFLHTFPGRVDPLVFEATVSLVPQRDARVVYRLALNLRARRRDSAGSTPRTEAPTMPSFETSHVPPSRL